MSSAGSAIVLSPDEVVPLLEAASPGRDRHVVFTLPAEVADLALANPAFLYNALFQAASATLHAVVACGGLSCDERGDIGVSPAWRPCSDTSSAKEVC